MTLKGTISRQKVWEAALKAKKSGNWCIEGFNEAMVGLGFRPITEVYIPAQYSDEGPLKVKPDSLGPCGNEDCDLCYENPRKLIKAGGYELHYADGYKELVEEQ